MRLCKMWCLCLATPTLHSIRPMPLHHWIERYPGVKRLLEQPEMCSKVSLCSSRRRDILAHPHGLPISIRRPTAWASVSRPGRG